MRQGGTWREKVVQEHKELLQIERDLESGKIEVPIENEDDQVLIGILTCCKIHAGFSEDPKYRGIVSEISNLRVKKEFVKRAMEIRS